MIRYFMLNRGDELIGQVDDEQAGYGLRTIKSPWRMMLTRTGGYAAQPMPCKSIELNVERDVMFEGDVDDDLVNVYRNGTSGLSVPANNKLFRP